MLRPLDSSSPFSSRQGLSPVFRKTGEIKTGVLPGLAFLTWFAAVAVWLTWTPFWFGPPQFTVYLLPRRELQDLVGNLLLLVPCGISVALLRARRPVWFAVWSAALLSIGLELGQLFLPDRIVSLSDILLNTVGAALGAHVALRLRQHWGPRRVLVATFALVLTAIVLHSLYTGIVFRRSMRLEDWDPEFEITVGNEVGGGRKYFGRVLAASICSGSVASRVCALPAADRATRRRLVRVAEQTQQVELQAQVISSLDIQAGPTRILTFSRGIYDRNLTLGQEGTAAVVRIRTPLTGSNGRRFEIWILNAIHRGVPTKLRVVFNRGSIQVAMTTPAGVRQENVTLGFLSAGILLRGGDGAITPTEVSRVRAVETGILILGLTLLVGAFADQLARRRKRRLQDRVWA